MNLLSRVSLYFHSIKYLKLSQIYSRLKKYYLKSGINTHSFPKPRILNTKNFFCIPRKASFLSTLKFDFLNVEKEFTHTLNWNDCSQTKLWLYNLHYFEGLLNQETPHTIKTALIQKWIKENPIGHGNGWEPYPNSLRIVNWIKWHFTEGPLNKIASESLVLQTRYLMKTLEYHLLGNHLFANAKALVFAGIFFEGPEPQKWLEKGIKILHKEIPEQFLKDGAHFELSPTYHALLTEDLLDILQLMRIADQTIPEEWFDTARKALDWLSIMTRADGLPPLFNDAAYGITPSFEDVLLLAKTVGLDEPEILKKRMYDLAESGYFRYECEQYSFFGDAGQIGPDYIPGHAHCDMLSFELFAYGVPLIVDTGVSTYEVCNRRKIERSTASHNTVQINGSEQSEIWGAFRVARRAKIIKREIKNHSVIAAYKGYKGNIHQRNFLFNPKQIVIEDKIDTKDSAIARIHFHPDILVEITGNIITAGTIKIEISNKKNIVLKKYNYAPEFNKLIQANLVEISFNENLETKIII